MSDLSSTRESTVLNNIANGGVYVSLHTADEGNEPDGSNEVSAADYSRVQLAEADISISGSAPTTLTNDVDINWGTTQNDWGNVTYGALWNDTQGATGEEPYTATVVLGNGGSAPSGIEVKILAGDLTFEMD
jgi:catalase (peroxidase I)